MAIPKGGRGIKAPYETVVIRVPKPIEPQVLQQIQDFRESKLKDLAEQPSQLGMINLAKSLILSKKSARVSLEKMLQVLYSDSEIKL